MKSSALLISAVTTLATALPAFAENTDFNLTYHVERTPKAKLSIETCGDTVVEAADKAGLKADIQSFPGQLVVVRGGIEGRGGLTARVALFAKGVPFGGKPA